MRAGKSRWQAGLVVRDTFLPRAESARCVKGSHGTEHSAPLQVLYYHAGEQAGEIASQFAEELHINSI